MQYVKEKDFLVRVFSEAYKMFYDIASLNSETKTKFDIVTKVDLSIEDFIISEIKKNYLDDVIFSEERNALQEIGKRTWIIDPIDGTFNMSRGIKLFGIQGALMVDGEIVMSVIYLPSLNEIYHAVKGKGAYCNEKQLSIVQRPLIQSVISFSDYPHTFKDQSEIQHRMIKLLHTQVAKIRMYGAACIDFTFVASGKIDATVCGTGYLWDIAPGMLLCSEAGAEVVNIAGKPFTETDFFAVAVTTKEMKDIIVNSAR